MKSLVIEKPGHTEWKEVADIHPGPGEVVSRVLATATCPHWDIHMLRGKPMFPGMELVYPIRAGRPGHEAVGEVVAVGAGVTNFKIGDRVASWRDEGFGKNGTYAEHMIQDAANLLTVPAGRDPLDYTSLELAMCVGASFLDIEKYAPLRGKRVFVQGLGPAGLIAVQMARALGAREVVALDINSSRFALAKSLGADACLSPIDPKIAGLTRSHSDAPDMVVECVGLAKSVNAALRMTKEIVVLFGVQREDYVYPVGSWTGLKLFGYPGHSLEAAEFAHRLITERKIELRPLYSKTEAFENYSKAVESLEKQEAVKIIFQPS